MKVQGSTIRTAQPGWPIEVRLLFINKLEGKKAMRQQQIMLYINEMKDEDIEEEVTMDEADLYSDQVCFFVKSSKPEEEKTKTQQSEKSAAKS